MSAERESLGNTTESASQGENGTDNALDICERYRLQSLIGAALPNARVAWCLKHRKANYIEIRYSAERKKAWYGGLMRCGSSWVCPLCARKLAEARRADLETLMLAGQNKAVYCMITYTARHELNTPLADTLTRMQAAYREIKSGRGFQMVKEETGWIGSVRAIEITWSPDAGWHPHYHELAVFDAGEAARWAGAYSLPASEGVRVLSNWLRNQLYNHYWLPALRKHSLYASAEHGLDTTPGNQALMDYISKYAKLPSINTNLPDSNLAGLSYEMAYSTEKAGRKKGKSFWELCALLPKTRGLVEEYYRATFKKAQLFWSRGLREWAGLGAELADNELVEADDPYSILAVLTPDEWSRVLRYGDRGRLIAIASQGDIELIYDYIEGLPELPTY